MSKSKRTETTVTIGLPDFTGWDTDRLEAWNSSQRSAEVATIIWDDVDYAVRISVGRQIHGKHGVLDLISGTISTAAAANLLEALQQWGESQQ